jgi:hypothetical protein
MKKVLCAVIIAGCICSSFATDARIVSMGRHDNFFMDEMSIFRNPANVNVYPNMILGSVGYYFKNDSLDKQLSEDADAVAEGENTVTYIGNTRYNRDPQDPYWGANISYSLGNPSEETVSQYPMISFGAVFNRSDRMLKYVSTESYPNVYLMEPLGKVDLILGYALKNGVMIGVGGYMGYQEVVNGSKVTHQSSLFKGSIGINWPVMKTMDLEVSLNGGAITAIGDSIINNTIDPTEKVIVADNNTIVSTDLRLFSALTNLNGDFIPHLGFDYINLKKGTITNFTAGVGVNINIDKGMFWAGVEGLYEDYAYTKKDETDSMGIGGKVSFGIERNVVWDWFVVRAGGMKTLKVMKLGDDDGTHWSQNPEADGSDDDFLGWGIGFNVENRLRMDFVIAEDIFYTISNMFSGAHHHMFTRFSATYSF